MFFKLTDVYLHKQFDRFFLILEKLNIVFNTVTIQYDYLGLFKAQARSVQRFLSVTNFSFGIFKLRVFYDLFFFTF